MAKQTLRLGNAQVGYYDVVVDSAKHPGKKPIVLGGPSSGYFVQWVDADKQATNYSGGRGQGWHPAAIDQNGRKKLTR